MNSYHELVRINNKKLFKRRYKERCRSQMSKSKRGMNYWSSVKDYVSQSLNKSINKIKPL